jgi:hypothetical protein
MVTWDISHIHQNEKKKKITNNNNDEWNNRVAKTQQNTFKTPIWPSSSWFFREFMSDPINLNNPAGGTHIIIYNNMGSTCWGVMLT